jgi:hypothetical protein
MVGQLGQDHGVEARGVGHQQRFAVPPEIVHGDVRAVGCREAGDRLWVGHPGTLSSGSGSRNGPVIALFVVHRRLTRCKERSEIAT